MSLPGSGVRRLDALDAATAMTLFSREEVGRLAFCMPDGPHVEVVTFVVVDGEPIFRIGVSAKLAAIGRSGVFALQCDRINTGTRTGWAVTVRGPVRILTDAEVDALPVRPDPWAPGERSRVVCLSPRQIFGRVLSVDDE